ncbi:MAG: amidohydrolase family protein [bacterium]
MAKVIDGYCIPGTERDTVLSAHNLIGLMDEAGIDEAVIAPEDREIALLNEQGNERILALAAESHGRFLPSCTVNPWHGKQAIQIVKDAVDRGAKMLVLAPALQGFLPGDEVLEDLLIETAAMRLPVYFHTGPHSQGAPSQVALLAESHPESRIIVGHCGVTDYVGDMAAILAKRLDNLWFELSHVRPWRLPSLLNEADESRLIYGSSAPRNDLKFEFGQFSRNWPVDRHPGTYGGNIEQLFGEVRG